MKTFSEVITDLTIKRYNLSITQTDISNILNICVWGKTEDGYKHMVEQQLIVEGTIFIKDPEIGVILWCIRGVDILIHNHERGKSNTQNKE